MDDALDVLALQRELLEEEGYRVSASPTILSADRIAALAPDLILTDLRFEARRAAPEVPAPWRADPRLGRLPVILCTAAHEAAERMAGELAAQRVRVVRKPFDVDWPLGEVAEALGEREGGSR
jgi:CheY-like chemotaxis protein